MIGGWRVVPTLAFQHDIERLEEHIVERELASHTPDDGCLFRFRDAVERALGVLSFAPHTCRRCEAHREFREMIVPFGHGGCVVLFAIREHEVLLLAARDPHEHDYR
ncbi:MAG: type II toxin-antitoxin system RelE/ParE family toxin [Burkholderiales bacterium]|nr:type II toxin-antitoxin system RelE/ParE family toxin [Burkholderiales bacterium]